MHASASLYYKTFFIAVCFIIQIFINKNSHKYFLFLNLIYIYRKTIKKRDFIGIDTHTHITGNMKIYTDGILFGVLPQNKHILNSNKYIKDNVAGY